MKKYSVEEIIDLYRDYTKEAYRLIFSKDAPTPSSYDFIIHLKKLKEQQCDKQQK